MLCISFILYKHSSSTSHLCRRMSTIDRRAITYNLLRLAPTMIIICLVYSYNCAVFLVLHCLPSSSTYTHLQEPVKCSGCTKTIIGTFEATPLHVSHQLTPSTSSLCMQTCAMYAHVCLHARAHTHTHTHTHTHIHTPTIMQCIGHGVAVLMSE